MWKQRLNSFKYAFKGIGDLFRSTPNARIHAFVAIVVIIAGFIFDISRMEWVALSITMAMVLSAEAFNTAIEYLTDLVSPDYHQLAGKTKDAAAGAVLLTAIGAVIVGLLIFLPKLLALF
ncbi:MAG: diacylglycerol kinase family protein [Bacteroidota bacterium]